MTIHVTIIFNLKRTLRLEEFDNLKIGLYARRKTFRRGNARIRAYPRAIRAAEGLPPSILPKIEW